MSQLTLALLGPFGAMANGVLITAFRTDKVRALLAYLALEAGIAHPRRTLAGLFWPDLPEQDALGNVRVTLHRLRTTLDAAIPDLSAKLLTITHQSVQLNGAAATVDAAEFEALWRAASPHLQEAPQLTPAILNHLDQAVALYRGELLAGLSLPDAPGFEEWLLLRREQLHVRLLLALNTLVECAEAQGELEKAHRYATQLLNLDPYRETTHRDLMRILTRRGLPDQALNQFAHLRRLLRDEMGVEPAPETVTLYEEIKAGRRKADRGSKESRESQGDSEDNAERTASIEEQAAPNPSLDLSKASPLPEWSEIPTLDSFFGRAYELARLEGWLLQENCQLVALLGIGGVGKTSLAVQTAQRVAPHFHTVVWRSLLNAPPLESLLAELLQTLAAHQLAEVPKSLDEQLTLLLHSLRRRRVLLVLDNVESILEPAQAGRFRPGYEGYQQLLQRVATSQHRSAILLTSREQPGDFARMEGDSPLVRSLTVEGLDEAAGRALLAARGIRGAGRGEATLVARYSGNPLALKLVADTVDALFGGDIESFLAEETFVFDDIRTMLDQQFSRLSELERELLFWLAIERKPVSVQTLRLNQVQPALGRKFLEALHSLQKRSLIETHPAGFALQNVVTEYLTARLIEEICAEVLSQEFHLLRRHAFLKASAEDDVRQSQARLLLAPIAAQLRATFSLTTLEVKLRQILARLHADAPRQPSYAGGNLLNLLLHLEIDVTGYDFSHLSVWQADLRGANLSAVNLADADLSGTTFTEDFGRIFAVAMHPQGHCLAAGDTQGKVRIWSLATGQQAGLLTGHANAVMAVAFSPDGALLASASLDRTIRIWDWQKGQCLQTLTAHSSSIFAVAFSPDGALLASGSQDCSVRLWDPHSGQQVATLTQHTNTVFALAFHPSGRWLVSGGADNLIQLWELSSLPKVASEQETFTSARLLGALRGHTHQVLAVAFSPDGSLLASGSADTTVRLWKWREQRALATLEGHAHWVRSVVFSPDGSRLISGSADRTIRIWDVAGQRALEFLHGHTHVIRALAIHPNGSLLASGGLDDTIRLWDLQRRQHDQAIRTIRGHVTAIRTLAFSRDGKVLATGDGKGWVRLWPVAPVKTQSTPQRMLPGRGIQTNSIAFSPDGRWLASGDDDRTVRLWDLASLQIAGMLRGHKEAVHTVHFSPQGDRMATAGYEGNIYVWDIAVPAQARLLKVLSGHTLAINALHFTPDGGYLISGAADMTIRVWDVAAGACVQVIEEERGHCKTLVLNPDGSLLAVAGWSGVIRLYQIGAQGRLLPFRNIQAHVTRIFQVAFSPDGTRLASGSEEGIVRLWDVMSGERLLSMGGHTQPVLCVAFHPNGTLIASGSDDETVRLWATGGAQPAGDCVEILRIPGPYTGMNIAGAAGISQAQRSALLALGAVESRPISA